MSLSSLHFIFRVVRTITQFFDDKIYIVVNVSWSSGFEVSSGIWQESLSTEKQSFLFC